MRVDEVYTSVQGEGPNVGLPTQFLRFGGCNLRCPGWPCDTQHAIDPKFRNNWLKYEPEGVIGLLQPWPRSVTLTGGEPFLQQEKDLCDLVQLLTQGKDPFEIDIFTNGTIPFPGKIVRNSHVRFIMDWKLPGSGEDFLDDKRITNNYLLTRRDAVKFTISDQRDYETAREVYEDYILRKDTRQTKVVGTPTRAAEMTPQVFAGVAWGKLANADLVKWMQHDGLPWRLNVQVHNYVWNREQRGI